jgi:3-oxoacyl-[acyl-carrier protein] reductase
MLNEFHGQVAVVTGASRGIGRATALELAQLGVRVLVNYQRNAAAAQSVVDEIAQLGGEALAYAADVSDAVAVQEMFKTTLSHWGRLDILINNAGITADAPLVRLKPDQWQKVIDIDLTSVFLCCQAALPTMQRQHYGRIINIGSLAGLAGNVGQANYAASKAGLVGFSRALAREVACDGVTVNIVAPGYIETELLDSAAPAVRAWALEAIALRRFGTPEEVAAAIAFLASSRSSYITGHVLVVDGGWVMP